MQQEFAADNTFEGSVMEKDIEIKILDSWENTDDGTIEFRVVVDGVAGSISLRSNLNGELYRWGNALDMWASRVLVRVLDGNVGLQDRLICDAMQHWIEEG